MTDSARLLNARSYTLQRLLRIARRHPWLAGASRRRPSGAAAPVLRGLAAFAALDSATRAAHLSLASRADAAARVHFSNLVFAPAFGL